MNGVLIRRNANRECLWEHDPRFSAPQKKALEAVAAADPEARLLGLDGNMRPVVEVRLGHPRAKRVYAIQRNGDPTAPVYVREGQMLSEHWSQS